jgi:simple sugar transport system ATP-binding protein
VDPAGIGELIIGKETAGHLSKDDADALIGSAKTEGLIDHKVGKSSTAKKPVLSLTNVSTATDPEGPALDQLSLSVTAGEIIGIAGVEGNGQRTLLRAISNLADVTSGDIKLGGAPVTGLSLAERRARGLRIIPFERNTEGLSLTSKLWENWSARDLMQRPLLSLINPANIRQQCAQSLDTWDVHYASTTQQTGSLSGGNAQKVILAREVDDDAQLIIAAQPTRGLDIGATAFVWAALREARERGCGVLLISSDLDELFDISDRVLVMLSGEVVGTFSPPYNINEIGLSMTGAIS